MQMRGRLFTSTVKVDFLRRLSTCVPSALYIYNGGTMFEAALLSACTPSALCDIVEGAIVFLEQRTFIFYIVCFISI